MSLAFTSTVASQSAQIAGNVGARLSIGPVAEILKSVSNVHVNKAIAEALSQRVQEMAKVVDTLLEGDALDLGSCEKHSEALKSFELILADTHQALLSQGRRGYLAQLLHQQRDRESLGILTERVDCAFKALMLEMRIQTTGAAAALSAQLVHMVENQQSLILQDPLSTLPGTAAHIPPQPQLFFGRQGEVQTVVHSLLGDTAGRIAILGGPGMGKTTLALASLHDPLVVQHFGHRRFFVSCETADSNPVSAISAAFGLMASEPMVMRVQVQRFIGHHPAVLVLDNFESVWEALNHRLHAESVLHALDSIDNLCLVVTMRGTERPHGIRWTRPFMPPLPCISNPAAVQTFLAISGVDDNALVNELLRCLDNIPLAIVLIANLAQYEPLGALMERWTEQKTTMLVRGAALHRLTSLDISIGLSVRSPRMLAAPGACELLGILAVLPQGVVVTDLDLWGIYNCTLLLSVLLQNSLVTRIDQRVYVLAPIRSFMLVNYAPLDAHLSSVYKHYCAMGELARAAVGSGFDSETFSAVSAELVNIDAVLDRALKHSVDHRADAIAAVEALCRLYSETGIGPGPRLLPSALVAAHELWLDKPRADLLIQWALLSFGSSIEGDPPALTREARDLYERIGARDGVINSSILLISCLSPKDGICEAQRLFSLTEALGDRRSMARCAAELAGALTRDGRLREAIVQHELAISILTSTLEPGRSDRLLGRSKCLIADIYRLLGDVSRAAQLYEESLGIYELTQSPIGANFVRMQLAEMLMFGRPQEAAKYIAQALADKRAINFRSYTACVFDLALANTLAGDVTAATSAMESLVEIRPATGFSLLEQGYILQTQGYIALSRGDLLEARALLGAARSTGRGSASAKMTTGKRILEASNLQALSDVAYAEGNHGEVAVFAISAAALFRNLNDSVSPVYCLVLLALALDDDGAARLLDALTLPLQRMRHDRGLAIALLRSAQIAQNHGQRGLAHYRAENALKRLSEIGDRRWQRMARKIQDECE
ncbi:hypothetical protein AURDEDRAFT_188879 [Auricularia subglabra TFB-10046 SS5]|uniref:Novel STAND NTPase 1 domain-containing protein n=1 Tax=Auricularia subglabra (strain TFB-10046 / SS5) TaxID=717982 RepID=J0D7C2_AURST|nr:hypothetical protein AURDEDRAFT_188879 [Auricularia subglabra TFB-10046 SS5]